MIRIIEVVWLLGGCVIMVPLLCLVNLDEKDGKMRKD